MSPQAGRQIVLINAAHFLTHYTLLILPTAVLVMARPGGEFGSEYGPVLALATAMFVLYGAGSLPQGWLAARIGRKALMVAFSIGTGAGLVAAGLVSGPIGLATALGVAGLFTAIYHPIGTAMLVEAAGARPGKSIGVNGVFGNLGVASAPIVTAFLAGHFGWRVAFIAPGLFGILLGFLWWREPVQDHSAHFASRPFPTIPPFLVRRAVTVLLAVAVVSGLIFNAFTLLLPKLMEERLAGDATLLPLIGALAFLVTICGALTQFSVGRLIDRTTLRNLFVPLAMLLAPALALLSFAQGWLVLPLAGLAAATIFGQVTVNETMTARYISPALRAKMYSVRFFVGFLGAAAAAPLVAFLYEQTGNLTAVTLVLSAFALVTLGCALFFPNRPEELQPELWETKAVPAE
jgi:MFS family permease